MSSDESENNQRTTNKKCETLKTGGYCFSNKTNKYYLIDVNGINNRIRRSASVKPNQDACFFDLPEETYSFRIYPNNLRSLMGEDNAGSFRIERCKSVTKTLSKNVRN